MTGPTATATATATAIAGSTAGRAVSVPAVAAVVAAIAVIAAGATLAIAVAVITVAVAVITVAVAVILWLHGRRPPLWSPWGGGWASTTDPAAWSGVDREQRICAACAHPPVGSGIRNPQLAGAVTDPVRGLLLLCAGHLLAAQHQHAAAAQRAITAGSRP